MKMLVDMNLSPRWVDVLIAANIEALHWTKPLARAKAIISTSGALFAPSEDT